MSDRRAAIRRERKEREKANKLQGSNGEVLRYAEQGKIDGRAISFCVMARLLHEKYKFGEQKIEKFLKHCNKDAARSTNEAVMFTMQFYADKLLEKINSCECNTYGTRNALDVIYFTKRDEYFVSSMAVMLEILASYYSFGSNSKNTGRLDIVMEYVTNEYLKLIYDKKRTVDWYLEETEKSIGFKLIKE